MGIPGTARLPRHAGGRAIERLELTPFIDQQDDRVRRRISIETTRVAQLVDARCSGFNFQI
jgi:hypothetical protein